MLDHEMLMQKAFGTGSKKKLTLPFPFLFAVPAIWEGVKRLTALFLSEDKNHTFLSAKYHVGNADWIIVFSSTSLRKLGFQIQN